MKSALNTLRLKSLSNEELRQILIETGNHVQDELKNLNTPEIITLIEAEAESDERLKTKLSKLEFSFKPSFYLTFIEDKSSYSKRRVTKRKIEEQLSNLNAEKDTEKNPSIREYQLFQANKTDNYVELHFLWQKIRWYWSPQFVMSNIYELNYGIAIIDLETNKAIISCHTKQERDDIIRVIYSSIGIHLKPLALTKPLLDQIGSFDTVKRARYFVSSQEMPLPQNITLGDKNLSTKPIAQEQENDDNISRKESFYKVQLNGVEEQGVGVTSETGKLWIPQKITVSEIKDYGISLLKRVSDELNDLTENEEYEKIFDSLGIKTSPVITAVGSTALRKELYKLFFAIANMLLKEESERAFTPNREIFSKAIPLYFNPFKIILNNSTGDYYCGTEYKNLFKLKSSAAGSKLISYIDKEEINEIIEEETGEVVSIETALERFVITPSPRLEMIFHNLLKSAATQFPKLNDLIGIPFRIESNIIKLDIDRAFGRSGLNFATEVRPSEINQLKQIIGKTYTYNLPDKILQMMGEKCSHMSDDNCSTCISDHKYACLRTLLGRTMANPYILSHKGIELTDLQGGFTVGSTELKIFVFAKMGEGNGKLTARNKNGGVLLGQILNQIEKSEFNTVCILTSATINEDLLSRLRLLCSTFNKKLLIINTEELNFLLGHWYEEIESEGKDPIKILKDSKKKMKTEINKYDRSQQV